MNLILVSSRMARPISLGTRQMALIAGLALALTAVLFFALGAILIAGNDSGQSMRLLSRSTTRQADVDALAIKLGELQAKLMRLDGLATQVGQKTGIDAAPFLSGNPAPRGGHSATSTPLSATSLLKQIHLAEQQIAAYQDHFTLVAASASLGNTRHMPVHRPVPPNTAQSSGFGVRIDPIHGRQNFHEGIDFLGEIGTPIQAAGNGIVAFAAYHPEYGNMIDIDHGNDLVSRYAHNARLRVKQGDTVSAGQIIAELGNSGRSTGAHLHFEIRYKNVPQNPLRFLAGDDVAENAGKNK